MRMHKPQKEAEVSRNSKLSASVTGALETFEELSKRLSLMQNDKDKKKLKGLE